MARILIVEDESNLAQGLLFNLKAEATRLVSKQRATLPWKPSVASLSTRWFWT